MRHAERIQITVCEGRCFSVTGMNRSISGHKNFYNPGKQAQPGHNMLCSEFAMKRLEYPIV